MFIASLFIVNGMAAPEPLVYGMAAPEPQIIAAPKPQIIVGGGNKNIFHGKLKKLYNYVLYYFTFNQLSYFLYLLVLTLKLLFFI